MVTATIAGEGTSEAVWRPWLDARRWPSLDLETVANRRVVVLAAHPDDEVLGAGGLLASLASHGHEIVAVWATDGEASHPRSTAITPQRLRWLRRGESWDALDRLGVTPVATHYLGLPDSALCRVNGQLRAALAQVIEADDIVIAPWSGDGHPDHETAGAAVAGLGAVRWYYPIWMWHWADPGDDRVPWHRVRVVPTGDLRLKAAAIDMFVTQVQPIGPAPEDAAILPPAVVARFLRPLEWILT